MPATLPAALFQITLHLYLLDYDMSIANKDHAGKFAGV
jgi:hypothetical protein